MRSGTRPGWSTPATRRHLAAAVLSVLLGACGSTGSSADLDRAKAEREIGRLLAKAYPDLAVGRVACPEHRARRKGGRLTCVARVESLPVHVRAVQTDDHGTLQVESREAVVSRSKAVAFVRQQLAARGVLSTVDCGRDRVLVRSPGETFDCSVRGEAGEGTVTLRVEDVDGDVAVVASR